MDKQSKLEYNFLKKVTIVTAKDLWDKGDLETLYRDFEFFLARSNINEISILRKGEVMLGGYCNTEDNDYNKCKDMIYRIINDNELLPPIMIAMIGALLKIYLSEKQNYNDIKEEK